MARQVGVFDVEERLAGISRKGDDLERLASVVDFEVFRPELERAVPRADRSRGGRPPFDHVLMFKVLVLQTQNNLSDERTEFYLRDRLTWMRFLGLGFGQELQAQGDLAVPEFGYQNHINADRRHRLIRRWLLTDAAAHAGSRLADLLDPDNTAADVWADTGYRSKANEELLRRRMLRSRIHRKRPARRPMPARTARANARKSAVRAAIEHVFAEQKARMGLFVRTIGLARATTKIGLANLVHNMRRLLWLDRQPSLA